MARITKDELKAQNEQIKAENEQLKQKLQQFENRKEQTMQKQESSEKKQNIWKKTYEAMAKAYLQSGKKSEFCFTARNYNDTTGKDGTLYEGCSKVIGFLHKRGGVNLVKVEMKDVLVDGTGRTRKEYTVYVKDFDINVENEGKFGKYKVFKDYQWALG